MLDGHCQLLNRQDGWQLVTSALGMQLLLTAACEGRGCLGDPTGGRGQSACGAFALWESSAQGGDCCRAGPAGTLESALDDNPASGVTGHVSGDGCQALPRGLVEQV